MNLAAPHLLCLLKRAAPRGVVTCVLRLALTIASLLVASCANVRFEKSPYAVRGVDVVYSEQEGMTFLSWRLRAGADPDLVEFELYQDGDYRPIDLERTAFAAEPFECEEFYLCFQYQLPGRYVWPEAIERPLRSIHVDEGLYAGSEPRLYEAEITFGIDPIALGRNSSIDPRRLDWFELNGVPLERDYQWQLTASSRQAYLTPETQQGGECEAASPSAWRAMGERVEPGDPGWIERPVCMAARPVHRADQGIVRNVPFPPAPMLAAEQQDYVPAEERPPILYLYLIDTLIRSQTRCDRTLNAIVGRVDANFGARAPDALRLGRFTPLDPQIGRPLSGCEQRADQDYPVQQMLDAIKRAAAELEPQRVRLVLVYLNNVDLPPSDRVFNQLQLFIFALQEIENVVPYTFVLGSQTIIELGEWSQTLGWSPIDDEIFLASIKAWGDITLPFRTMLHDAETAVQINRPVPASERPELFKLCSVTPGPLLAVGLPASERLALPTSVVYPWPEASNPDYLVLLPDQVLIPNLQYQRLQVSVVVEVCERFCDHPFRTSRGVDLEGWASEPRCQWKE